MTTIKLSETEKYKKFETIRRAGYNVDRDEETNKLILSDTKVKNLEQFFDTVFNNVDDILIALKDQLNCKVVR